LSTKKTARTTFVISGTARYPKLDQPYYYDKAAKKSFPDPTGQTKGCEYQTEIVMTEQEAAPHIAKLKAFAEDFGLDTEEVKNWPFSKEKDKETKKPTGNVVFKVKGYATNRDGSLNRIIMVDSKLSPLPKSFRLTSGSTIAVNGYLNPFKELGGGVSLRLNSVQVLKYVEREVNLDGFAAVEDGFTFDGEEENTAETTVAKTGEASNGAEETHDF